MPSTMRIGGARVEADDRFDVVNPASGAVFATAPSASAGDVERAVLAADEAFATWRRDEGARRKAMHVAADADEAATADLAALVSAEQDKPMSLPAARFTVGEAVSGWRRYAELHDGWPSHPPADRTAGSIMGYTSGTTGRPKGVRRPLRDASPEADDPITPHFGRYALL